MLRRRTLAILLSFFIVRTRAAAHSYISDDIHLRKQNDIRINQLLHLASQQLIMSLSPLAAFQLYTSLLAQREARLHELSQSSEVRELKQLQKQVDAARRRINELKLCTDIIAIDTKLSECCGRFAICAVDGCGTSCAPPRPGPLEATISSLLHDPSPDAAADLASRSSSLPCAAIAATARLAGAEDRVAVVAQAIQPARSVHGPARRGSGAGVPPVQLARRKKRRNDQDGLVAVAPSRKTFVVEDTEDEEDRLPRATLSWQEDALLAERSDDEPRWP
jgi:hypothetical protein